MRAFVATNSPTTRRNLPEPNRSGGGLHRRLLDMQGREEGALGDHDRASRSPTFIHVWCRTGSNAAKVKQIPSPTKQRTSATRMRRRPLREDGSVGNA